MHVLGLFGPGTAKLEPFEILDILSEHDNNIISNFPNKLASDFHKDYLKIDEVSSDKCDNAGRFLFLPFKLNFNRSI